MYNVVYYSRVSTEEEKQLNALEQQIKELEDFIEHQLEWRLVDRYIDEGKSGTTTKKRNEYNRLIHDIDSDKFDIIVIKDQTRLMRNTKDWYIFIDKLVSNQKKLFFYLENEFYKSDNALITGIKAILAEEYSRDLSKKINNAHKHRAIKGTPVTNGLTWGYTQLRDSKKLTINEEEAVIIRKIFNWYVEGKGFRIIYKLLEEEGIRNRNGKPFALTTLKRIIKNEKYKGTLVSNKSHKDFDTKKIYKTNPDQWIVHENAIPAIVTEELWDKANKVLNTKKKKRIIEDKEVIAGCFLGNHVYSNKIFCGKCGNPFWHTIINKKSLWQCREYRSFGIKKDEKEHGCWNHKLYTNQLDNMVKYVIFNFINNKSYCIDNLIKVFDESLTSNIEIDNIDKLEQEKNKLNKRKDKLIDMLSNDLITKDEYISKKQNSDTQLSNLEKKLSEYKNVQSNIATKSEKLIHIKGLLPKQITSVDQLLDDSIIEFLDRIEVKSETEINVLLNCGYNKTINSCEFTTLH